MAQDPLAFSGDNAGMIVEAICRDLRVAGIDFDIAAQDEMLFFFLFSQGHDIDHAASMYLDSGRRIWATERQILAWRFGSPAAAGRILDLASGYGRVTRHMVAEVPPASIWVSDLYGAQQGHADLWQVCLAHQLRDCTFAIEAGDAIFAPRMKALLLRAVVLARRRTSLAESTRRAYQQRLDRELDKIMALAPINQHGRRLRKRYGKVRSHLFTFLAHPDAPPDNNGSERELRPTATYRKVTGGFRSNWGADLFANVRSVVGTAARHGIDAYHAIQTILRGVSVLQPG